jgi:hypothetical protein
MRWQLLMARSRPRVLMALGKAECTTAVTKAGQRVERTTGNPHGWRHTHTSDERSSTLE